MVFFFFFLLLLYKLLTIKFCIWDNFNIVTCPICFLQEIQETLLPPSVHIYPKKKTKKSQELGTNGVIGSNEDKPEVASTETGASIGESQGTKSIRNIKNGARSSSPYPNVC